MRKITFLLFVLLAALSANQALATVSVTTATGGTGISADKAANATTPQWTTLGNITITEGSGKGDIPQGSGLTMILNAPTGWEFNPGVGTASFNASKDITSASAVVTSSAITVTYSSPTINSSGDFITVSGIQVRALSGSALPSSGNIYMAASSTALPISGITSGSAGTSFGALSEVVGAAAKLAYGVQPTTATAAAVITPAVTVRLLDQFDDLTASTATVTVAIGNNAGGGTLAGTASVAAVGGVATFSTLSINKAGTGYTLAASSPSLTGATSSSFDINPGSPSKVAYFVQPSNTTAGSAITPAVVVRILDAQDNLTASTANVTLAIGANPGAGTLSGTATQAAVAGVATFSDLSINKSGTGYTLTAASGGLTGATSTAFNINAGTPSQLVFGQQPTGTTAGTAIAPAVTVRILDALGNLTASTANITVALGNNPGLGTLSGTATQAAVAGVATFSNLSINRPGTGYTLTADGASLPQATSSAFNITPGAATVLSFTTEPASATAGAIFGVQPVVKTRDSSGNLSTVGLPGALTLTITLSSGTGTLVGTATQPIGAGAVTPGVATFTNLRIDASGAKTLTASATGLTPAVSQSFTVSAAATSSFVVAGFPTTTTVGTTDSFTVTARDAFGNTTPAYAGTVTFTTDGTATLPSPYTFQVADNGTRSFQATFTALGTGRSITASAPGPITGSQAGINIIAPVITKADASIAADTAAPSTSWTTLTGPAYTEPATGNVSTGTIELNAPSGFEFDTGGTAPTVKIDGDGTASKNINGAATGSSVAITSRTASKITFTVTGVSSSPGGNGVPNKLTWQNVRVRPTLSFPLASGNITETGTATMVGVTPGSNWGTLTETPTALHHFALAVSGSQTAGIAFPVTMTAQDQFNNTVPSFVGTVTLTATSGSVTPSASAAFVAGVRTESITLNTGGLTQTLTATEVGGAVTGSTTVVVDKQSQLIGFAPLGDKTYGDADFTVNASATSGLTVTYAIQSGPATILGNLVHITGAGLVVVRASQAGNATYSAAADVDESFTADPASVTPHITADSKVYDSFEAAQIATRTLTGVIGLDDVSLVGGAATFDNKNVGVGKTVTAFGLSLSGTKAGDYQLTSDSAVTTADITPATVTVTGITAASKVYDGDAIASLDTTGASLVGTVVGDDATLVTAGAAGQFDSAQVGNGKTVTVSGLSLTGAAAGNYNLVQPATTASITAKALTVTGITADNKVYDATTTATLNTGAAALVGVVGTDDATLVTSGAAGQFADAAIGTGKTVTVSGLALSGAAISNYILTQPTTTADITAKALTVTGITADNKIYDGNTTATLNLGGAALQGVAGADSVSLDTTGAVGQFADASVGAGKTVTISGLAITGDTANYTLTQPSTTADIIAALVDWRSSFFSAGDLADPNKEATVWGDLADPDGDGRSNLLEYALGLNPTAGSDAGEALTSAVADDQGSKYSELTYKHRLNDPGLSYVIEVSTDKSTWTPVNNVVNTTAIDAEFEWVTVRDTTAIPDGGARLIRLRVIKN